MPVSSVRTHKIQILMNSQSNGEGGVSPPEIGRGKKERSLGSSRPSTSYCDQIPNCQSEDVQSWVKQQKRGGNEEESYLHITPDEEDVYEPPKTPSRNPLSSGLKCVTEKPISPTKAFSKKTKIPIIEAQPLKRRRRDCHVTQAENSKASDYVTFQRRQEFQSTSHDSIPAVVSAPAVVATKNVQNVPKPKSIAEQLGFKKPKRRASDQSEDSLDRVKELRLRGREVQVGSKLKTPTPHTLKYKNMKLDPQETQFHKQKHDQIHKVAATSSTNQTTPMSPTMSPKKARSVNQGEKYEDHEKMGDDAVNMLKTHNWNIQVILGNPPSIPDDQPEETVQHSSSPQTLALETPTTLHQSGDSQKIPPKCSMTTVKTFTPSSRNDSLVKDMEKLGSPKPKAAHQVHTSQPPLPALPEVRKPVAKVLPFLADEQADEEASTHQEHPPRDRQETHTETFTSPPTYTLKACILKWKYSWFRECDFDPPKALCDQPLKLVKQNFLLFKDYFNTFFPLILTNTFEELVSEWQRGAQVMPNLKVESVNYDQSGTGLTVTNANFTVRLTHEQKSRQLYPKENDIVILWLPQHGRSNSSHEHRPDNQPHFGFISLSEFRGARRELNLEIMTCGNVLANEKQLVQCVVVGSILNAIREFRALCQIDNSAFIQTIMAPTKHSLTNFKSIAHFQIDPESTFEGCNTDQSNAINCVISMVMSKQPTPQMCMIHGPPGTGKSHTIVNLLYQLSQRLEAANPTGQKHWRILVCAPSIAAVDSLVVKINMFFKNKTQKHKGNCGDVNLVRWGNDNNIDKRVMEFSLRHQIKTRISEDSLTNPERCQSTKRDLEQRILQESHIICSTLSSSGSSRLKMAFPSHRHDDTPFNCVIIDEAGQAKETETLIPLLFHCPSLVLVGDVKQISHTVISQKTKEKGFDQSLIARLYNGLRGLTSQNVFFLSKQYRMHPDIQSFPSKYFYRDLLKTDGMMAENLCSSDWPCEAYRVFDVTNGLKTKGEKSYYQEVKLIVELVQLVLDNYHLRSHCKSLDGVVGVITPCSAQKALIQDALQENHLQNVVVDSISGFQGREMDCIIVSCVQPSNEIDSIRFLKSPQQMNFSITRAKYSLFVVGHLNTLKKHRHWRALIDDAESRGAIIRTSQRYDLDAREILKRDICSFPSPTFPSQRAQPSYPDALQNRLTYNHPQPPEYYHSCEASSRDVPHGSAFSWTSSGHSHEYSPRYQTQGSRYQTFRAGRDRHYLYEHDDYHVPIISWLFDH